MARMGEGTAHDCPTKGHLSPLREGTAQKYLVTALPNTEL